ncbi:DMT family transporter [Nocardia beijingensis]|uniref:DMT family transporter n=1 Tax=Nocardia beijingensis TaxID=95162 RepID=UPI001895C559|nr:DMT family transporter [Nocardia beijingensis]MBF6469267.1 DMT family transporter [Nocardia beijingensis]
MSTHWAAAVLCALLAALLFAVAAVAQQSAAAAVPENQSLIRSLLRTPRWWAGVVGDAGGYAMQVAALALGAVLLVQPILVSALVFALPLSARLNDRRVTPSTWATALALTAALACFVLVGDPTEGETDAPLRDWLLPLGLLVGLIAAATAAGIAAREPAWRALLLGVASGALYGLAAALTDYVTGLFEHGLADVLSGWQTWALVAAGVTGVYLQQRAYQVGPLTASLPAVTVAEPLAAAFIGIAVLDERLRADTAGLVVTAGAVVVMVATTIMLSRSEAVA